MKTKKNVPTISLSSKTDVIVNHLRCQGLPVDSGAVICAVVMDSSKDGREAVLFIQVIPEVTDPVTRRKSGGYCRRALHYFDSGTWKAGEIASGARITRRESTNQPHNGWKLVETKEGTVVTHQGQPVYAVEELTAATEKDVFLPRDKGNGSNIAQ